MDAQTLETTLHWVYVGAMVIGALIFIAWSRDPQGVPGYEYAIATAIPVWSGIMYALMALGYGKVPVDGQITYLPRYFDWLITTPLLVLALGLGAMIHTEKRVPLLAALVGTDAAMIASGLIADLSVGTARYVWYGLGVVFFVVLLWLTWGPVRNAAAQHPDARIAGVYNRMAGFLTLFWIGYPLVWLLGPSGIGAVSQTVDTLMFVLLPVISKVGFSLYSLSQLRALDFDDTRATLRQRPA